MSAHRPLSTSEDFIGVNGSVQELAATLVGLDGKSYKAYKQITGRWEAPDFALFVEHVQGDPFADPSRLRALVPRETAGLPEWARSTAVRRRAAADFLNRALARELARRSSPGGSGNSGRLRVLEPGQQILIRGSMQVAGNGEVTARFRAGLPARGRRIAGKKAAALMAEAVPAAIRAALDFAELDGEEMRRHLETAEDSAALRDELPRRGLVAFVADDALLPRASGISDQPLGGAAVPFRSPESLRVVLTAPNRGEVPGMGIPEGVTLIVGGGYHGKSTLLQAIERGIYDHIPGDGRECVVTVPSAVKVRAEDGRSVAGVDISNFIGRLPSGADTARFQTENASGSTSQAAAIAESLAAGTRCLLLDEDTSATNFMIRDARMQALIADRDEPITPFIDRARTLYEDEGVSTILVVGGSGDYFDVADTVVAMREYLPHEVTEEARAIAQRIPTARRSEGGSWRPVHGRRAAPDSIDPSRNHRDLSIRIHARDRVEFGTSTVDLVGLEQLAEKAQTRAIAHAAAAVRDRLADATIEAAAGAFAQLVAAQGLEGIHPHGPGELAEFRGLELAGMLNRLRSLQTRREGS